MFKKFLAVATMLIAFLAFTQPSLAVPWAKKTGEECDKTQKKDCDKKKKADCDKRHSKDCDKKDHKNCDKGEWKGSGERHSRVDYKRGKGGFNILMIADKIGLSADQVKDIKGIKSSHKKTQIMTDAEITVLKIELKELSHDYSTDIDIYADKVREIEAKEGDKKIAKFKMRKDISAIMTPEQRNKIKEYYRNKYKK
jgi:hypothetical protein